MNVPGFAVGQGTLTLISLVPISRTGPALRWEVYRTGAASPPDPSSYQTGPAVRRASLPLVGLLERFQLTQPPQSPISLSACLLRLGVVHSSSIVLKAVARGLRAWTRVNWGPRDHDQFKPVWRTDQWVGQAAVVPEGVDPRLGVMRAIRPPPTY